MVVVYWTSGLLMAFIPPVDIPIDLGLRVDPSAFAFALAVSAITGILFGLAPAWQASKPDTVEALNEEAGRGGSGRTGHRLRSALAVGQVAVSVILLAGGGLFARSFTAARLLDPGFDPGRQATASMDLFSSGYTPETGRQFHRRALERVSALPGVQSVALRPLADHMEQAFFAQRIGANLLGAMGALALLLAAVGLYGVIAYATSQRTHEMGIRLALGAAPGDLRRMVVAQGARLVGVGLAIGLAAALGATPLVRSLLPGIAPVDPITFAAVPVALLVIALVAAWIPARRASGVDPVVALRHD